MSCRYANPLAFTSIIHIINDVGGGWLVRVFHRNGARLFFLSLYFHIGRGLFYGSFHIKEVWGVGFFIFLMRIGVAFLGYVLP